MDPAQTIPGYRATRTDKALVIHDVEIFSACERDDFVADETWVRDAVAKVMAEAREGYFPPLHTRHHGRVAEANDAVKCVGHFQIIGVRPITLAGKVRNAVFADLHVKDEWAQKQILDELMCYRSVEIFDTTAPPSIDGLALLDHEAPFLRLPMLMVSDVQDRSQMPSRLVAQAYSPRVACFAQGHSFNPLERAENMNTKTKIDASKFGEGVTSSDAKPVQFMDEPEKKDDDKGEQAEGDDGGGLDIGSLVKAIQSGEISVNDMKEILAAIQSQGGEEAAPEEELPAPTAAPGAEAMKANQGAMSAEMAAREGKIVALEARLDERDASDQRRDDVAAALTRLDGLPAGADLEARLVKFHKRASGDAELFGAFVDSIAQNTAPAVNPKTDAFQGSAVPDAAMKYMDQGTGEVDRAAQFGAQWKPLHDRGLTRMTQERYIEINMNASTQEEI